MISYQNKLVWVHGDYLKVTLNSTPKPDPQPETPAQAIGSGVCTAKSGLGKYSYLTMDVAKDYYTFALRMDGWTYQTGMDPYQVPRSFVSRRITLPDFLWFIDPSGKTN